MPIRFINTCKRMNKMQAGSTSQAFYKKVQSCHDTRFDLLCWKQYAESISPGLSAKCLEDAGQYDLERDVFPVIKSAFSNRGKMELASRSFQAAAANFHEKMHLLFDRNIDLDIILYFGLCNGAGWATKLDGRMVILLGMEKIVELDWCQEEKIRTLVYHEIGHVWHEAYGNFLQKAASQQEQSMQQLHQEGIAMVCEHILCGSTDYYHQNVNGWLDWCTKNEVEIKKEYLRRIKAGESTQDFFGDWCSYQGHSDLGYYLGCRFVEVLQKKYSLIEIANLDHKALLHEFEAFAQA